MNKIALVTGANRGIGYAVAQGLLEKNCTVIVTSRSPDDGKKAVEKLSQYGNAVYHQLDVTDSNSVDACYAFAKAEYHKLDILINNAGINYDTWHEPVTASLDEVNETMATNLMAPWRMVQTFIPLLEKSDGARIVNVSSGAGSLESQNGNTPGYSISKLALNGLTMQLAAQLKDRILVNSVCPGWVRTDMGGSGADRSPQEGAETIIWAGLLEDKTITGKFLRDKKVIDW